MQKNKLKVLIIQPWISYRGAETVSVNQCYWLNRLGHESKIAAIFVDWRKLPDKADKIKYLLPTKTLSEVCKRSPLLLFLLGPALLFWVVLRNVKNFDVLNPHNLPSVWIASILGRISGKKIVWTSHSVPRMISWRKKTAIFEYFAWFLGASVLDKWAVKSVDLIVSVSNKVKREVKERYNLFSVVIPPFINKTKGEVKRLPKDVLRLREESELLLLHVGSLNPQKNQSFTLKLLQRLNKKGYSASTVFVGEGPDKGRLEKKAVELGVDDRVFFAGFIPQSMIGAYYDICNLSILPSIHESFATTALEALTHEKISLVSADSGAAEDLSGYIMSAKVTREAMYHEILEFLNESKKFKSLAHRGRRYVLDNFNGEKLTKRFIQKIKSVYHKEISPEIYDNKYYEIHYKRANKHLLVERENRINRAIELLEIGDKQKILDLGCGDGELSIKLAELGAEVWGVDYSPDAIALAQEAKRKLLLIKTGKAHFRKMNATNLNFPDDFFDRIICIDVFEHVYSKALERVIDEMKRVTKPGGIIVVETSPNSFYLKPFSFFTKKVLGIKELESEEYHINIFDYFKFKKSLQSLGDSTRVDVVNDGHQYFSSRLAGVSKIPSWVEVVARIVDFVFENPLSEKMILSTPLKIFLAHDLWGVVTLKNE